MKFTKNRGKWIPTHKENRTRKRRDTSLLLTGGKETMLCSEDRFVTLIVSG